MPFCKHCHEEFEDEPDEPIVTAQHVYALLRLLAIVTMLAVPMASYLLFHYVLPTELTASPGFDFVYVLTTAFVSVAVLAVSCELTYRTQSG